MSKGEDEVCFAKNVIAYQINFYCNMDMDNWQTQ
jgi:hypothetical protein